MSKIKTISTYKGHPVITGEIKEFKYNTKHLDNNLKLMKATVARHNKVLAYRIDIRLPQNKQINEPNKFISNFMSCYTKKLSRNGLDPAYVVKTEQQASDNPHFHCQMLVDGNKVKNSRQLIKVAEDLLGQHLNLPTQGLIDYCNKDKNGNPVKNEIMIRRDSTHCQEQFDDCFKQMSYLAKDTHEDKIPSSTRKVSYSRINKKKCRSKK